jgi:hypothetical protein
MDNSMTNMTPDLSDDDLAEMIGDRVSTHLPFVRLALEVQRRRSAERTIPPNIKSGIDRYAQLGVRPGDCLYAILCGNLREAFARADPSTTAAMGAIVSYLRDRLPSASWGSPDAVRRYLDAASRAPEGSR